MKPTFYLRPFMSTLLEPGPQTQEAAQPEEPKAAKYVPAETVETAGIEPKQAVY